MCLDGALDRHAPNAMPLAPHLPRTARTRLATGEEHMYYSICMCHVRVMHAHELRLNPSVRSVYGRTMVLLQSTGTVAFHDKDAEMICDRVAA